LSYIHVALSLGEVNDHMTVRRLGADGNSRGPNSDLSDSGPRRALLTLRAVVILSGGLAVGIVTGLLAYLAVHNPADAILAGLPACAGAIKFLDAVVD
jgi:hypothetical protein